MNDNEGAERSLKIIFRIFLIILAAVLSFTFVGDLTTSPDNRYNQYILRSVDEKKDTVMMLTASSTLASVAVSVMPDDIATPISEKLADLTEDFLLVLCVLYGEKYLFTVFGTVAFRILIPAACVLLILYLLRPHRFGWMKSLVIKIILFALMIYAVIPVSVLVADHIDKTYQASIQETYDSAEQFSEEVNGLKKDGKDLWGTITDAAAGLIGNASEILNRIVEALAIMIVTTCVIPILVLLAFIWLIYLLTGVEIPLPEPLRRGSKRIRGQKGNPRMKDADQISDADDPPLPPAKPE